jgi:hypothetical protein
VTIARGTKPWPPDNPDAIPRPPVDLPGRAPALRPDRPDLVWRLHWEDNPNDPPRYPSGRWRFDAPDGSYPVTYANLSKLHIFVEVYGDTDDAQVIEDQADRQLSYATLNRDIDVIDLGDSATLRALNLDLRIATTCAYDRTMLWGQRLRTWLPDAEGIRYLGRKGGREENFCLFLDKCADALEWTCCGTLAENEHLVLRAGDAFNMTFDFTVPDVWPRGSSRW